MVAGSRPFSWKATRDLAIGAPTERMRGRDDLKAPWQHIVGESGLDDGRGVDALLLELHERLGHQRLGRAEDLQVVGDGGVVEREGHDVGFPHSWLFWYGATVHGNPLEWQGRSSLHFRRLRPLRLSARRYTTVNTGLIRCP